MDWTQKSMAIDNQGGAASRAERYAIASAQYQVWHYDNWEDPVDVSDGAMEDEDVKPLIYLDQNTHNAMRATNLLYLCTTNNISMF